MTSYIQEYDLENGVKVTPNLTCLKSVTTVYPLKSDEYPSICSGNISFLAIKQTFVSWLVTLKIGPMSPTYRKLFRLSLKVGSPLFQVYRNFAYLHSRLSLSRSRRDPLKHFEISVLRHIRCSELRKIPNEQQNFTNEHVI